MMSLLDRSFKTILVLVAFAVLAPSAWGEVGTSQQLLLEAQIQSRILAIVAKVDKAAIVQVKVDLKKVNAVDLPGTLMGASVIPLEADGSVASEGIDRVQVRVVSQLESVPDWIKDEVKASVNLGKIKVDMKFEKAKGVAAQDDAKKDSLPEALKELGKELGAGLTGDGKAGKQVAFALWGIVIGLGSAVLFVTAAIFLLGRKIEQAFFKSLDEKLIPALQQAGSGGGGRSERTERAVKEVAATPERDFSRSLNAGSSESAFSQLSPDALLSLVMDCYWTKSDGYAHFIWTELSQKQKENLLGQSQFGKELYRYFTFVRQFSPQDMNYQSDVRYFEITGAFNAVDQDDLAKYVKSNPEQARFVSPLRWDLLAIPLAERLKITVTMNQSTKEMQTVSLKPSRLRELPRKLEVKVLSAEDELFLWENVNTVPKELRAGLKTLVWLAASPLEYREGVLRDIDARDLANVWSGPDAVLASLQAAISPKKFEMVQSFAKGTIPDRNDDVFEFLVSAGVSGLADTIEISNQAAA